MNNGSFSGVAKRVAHEEGIRCVSPKTAPTSLPTSSQKALPKRSRKEVERSAQGVLSPSPTSSRFAYPFPACRFLLPFLSSMGFLVELGKGKKDAFT